MNKMKKIIALLIFSAITFTGFSQDEDNDDQAKSNIQTYTPSKLLKKGQWDIKFFNNLYTQTKVANSSGDVSKNQPRETYFTSTIDVFTGVSENSKLNVGLLIEMRSNVVGNRKAFDIFKFDGERGTARSGVTSIAPAIKFNPLKNVNNFTIQTAFHIPLVDNEVEDGVFLDQTAYTFQNRFFYDYTFPSGDWQLFTELNTEYNFGEKTSFADKTFVLAPGVFLSYFPNQEFTILGFVQHQQRVGDFEQDFTALGLGGKYQLSKTLNLEVLYSNFVRGSNSGLGQSFNLGLRALF
ncbi:transporter [Gaetbulibacter sp. 2012CJ34-3]|uniref:Transporter n=2 Tax=Jejuia spongiicola TaxID=2942207 RepID=A0ABT0QAN7_9FLAO|nr:MULTISPECIES: hypothetical protein [Flavobacteriaceae]MCL6294047.1 transporter [Jejuia spongiicola]